MARQRVGPVRGLSQANVEIPPIDVMDGCGVAPGACQSPAGGIPMSWNGPRSEAPPVYTGPDGLPHCSKCTKDALCLFHRHRVTQALNACVTPHLLMNAETDLRYVLRRPTLRKEREE